MILKIHINKYKNIFIIKFLIMKLELRIYILDIENNFFIKNLDQIDKNFQILCNSKLQNFRYEILALNRRF